MLVSIDCERAYIVGFVASAHHSVIHSDRVLSQLSLVMVHFADPVGSLTTENCVTQQHVRPAVSYFVADDHVIPTTPGRWCI